MPLTAAQRQQVSHVAKKRIIADLEQFQLGLDSSKRQPTSQQVNELADQLHISFVTLLEQTETG